MTFPENMPAHVREALQAASRVAKPKDEEEALTVLLAVEGLHRAGLLAGDRDCTCNRTEDGQRLVTHQRGDADFCRDTFEPLTRSTETA